MLTYVYRVAKPDGRLGLTFKVQQSMRDAPLTHHPVTRQPVVRVPQALTLPTNDGHSQRRL